jgi:hypothetical protein
MKWNEARRGAGGRVAARNYWLPCEQRPEEVVAGSPNFNQEASLEVLPAQNQAVTDRQVPGVDEEPCDRQMQVAFLQDIDLG